MSRLQLGVSACLLGQQVRYDGNHAHDTFVTQALAAEFTLIAVCPETELGMGIPRETVGLTGTPDAPHMVGTKSGRDWTAAMNQWCTARLAELDALHLAGFICKSKSPSCGLVTVSIKPTIGEPITTGSGLFTTALQHHYPNLPVIESKDLADTTARATFLAQVRAAPQR